MTPRIPVHDLDSAPKASRDTLAALRQRYGMILHLHGEMAHSPVMLATYAGIQDAITEHGTFHARTREAIALAVAARRSRTPRDRRRLVLGNASAGRTPLPDSEMTFPNRGRSRGEVSGRRIGELAAVTATTARTEQTVV